MPASTIDFRNTLCDLMGHGHDVSDEVLQNSIVTFQSELVNFKSATDAEITKLTNSAAKSESSAAALIEENKTLKNSTKALTEELVNYDLAKFDGVIANKAEVREALLNDRSGTVKTLLALKPTTATANPNAGKQPLYNAKTAGQPKPVIENSGFDAGQSGRAEDVDEQTTTKIMNRCRELQKTGKYNYQQAFMAARGEILAN